MVFVAEVAVLFWYVLKALGRRVPSARRLVRRLTPWTGRLHAWILSAPATFCYIAVFTCFTLVQATTPPHLIDIMTTVNSTNLDQLHSHALTVLATSAFWVDDHGSGLDLYILAFATFGAFAERRWGTPRLAVIAVSGHVLGSLLTEAVLRSAIDRGRAPVRLENATDVGVSYILVASLAAAVLAMHGRARLAFAAVLLGILITPMITSGTVWDLGHIFAAICGLAVAALCRLAGPLRASQLQLKHELVKPVPQQA
ncbi:rhomboid-like protein [Catenulispora rubra]|uniref:rhomboid-like protein n=1 Tax=Catenulispora rubra TaxID=280293 RepID=UPI00189236CE|nr:rhomboid-like protein [Catenulispora rubra]